MFRPFALAAVAILTACASSPSEQGASFVGSRAEQFTMGDGQTAWIIHCDGPLATTALCFDRAAQVCTNGFDPLDDAQRTAEAVNIANAFGSASFDRGVSRSMIVTCRGPAALQHVKGSITSKLRIHRP